MKGTDDGKTIDGQDAGAIPAASTKHQVSYQGIFDFSKAFDSVNHDISLNKLKYQSTSLIKAESVFFL